MKMGSTSILTGGFFTGIVTLSAGCGQVLSLEDHRECPCAPGWSCCANVCVVGECDVDGGAQKVCSSIALGSQAVPGGTPQTLAGFPEGVLESNLPVRFDYGLSMWLEPPHGMGAGGWLLGASANQSFQLEMGADVDGGGAVPLPFRTYGPLTRLSGPNAGCVGAVASDVGTLGSKVTWTRWTAPMEGTYFIMPVHAVSEGDASFDIQGFEDPRYAHAFLTMKQAGSN